MRRKTMSLHGRFVEAYLYFDFAWLVSRDGSVRAFDIDRYCSERLNGNGNAASTLFANNQRLPRLRDTPDFNRFLRTDSAIDVSEDDVDAYSYVFEAGFDFKSIFDLRFYYGRAYLSTEKSIKQFRARGRDDFEMSSIGRTARDKLYQKHVWDQACRQFQCRYGVVAAACGRHGGLMGLHASSDDPNWEIEFRAFTDISYGIELTSNAVSNLRTRTEVEFFAARSDRSLRTPNSMRGEESERQGGLELKGVAGRAFQHQAARIEALVRESGLEPVRAYLFKTTIWMELDDGTFRRVKTADGDELAEEPELKRGFKAPGRILSTSNTEMGVVVESDDKVYIYRGNGWPILVDDQVYSARGYMNSKRYRNLVTAVRREQVDLIAIIG